MERDPTTSSSSDPATRVRPLDWPQAAGHVDAVARGIDAFVRRRRRRRSAIVAALGLMLITALSWRAWHNENRSLVPVAAATATVSLPARETLPDGSIVELKTGAEIATEFTRDGPGPRRVILRRGEAYFTVAKNPQRPFIVVAGGIEVRAVGTAFSVDRWAGAVEVLVTEGRVAVDHTMPVADIAGTAPVAAQSTPPLAFVDAGNRAVVSGNATDKEARVQRVSSEEINERVAWRVPRLEFNATPLAEVIALCNRHAVAGGDGVVTRLTLADPALGRLPLSGVLRADNVSVLLQILESSYGILAERRADGEIVLRDGR
jgi:transmembrane sensor